MGENTPSYTRTSNTKLSYEQMLSPVKKSYGEKLGKFL